MQNLPTVGRRYLFIAMFAVIVVLAGFSMFSQHVSAAGTLPPGGTVPPGGTTPPPAALQGQVNVVDQALSTTAVDVCTESNVPVTPATNLNYQQQSGFFTLPAGEYNFTQFRGTYTLGQQRPLSGGITAGRSTFYNGTLTELGWTGRVEFTHQFYAEPTLSWNRVDVPWGLDNVNLVSTRATYTISPRMFVSALIQYQSRTDSITTNARLRWEYQPGSELFVVYNDGRNTLNGGFPQLDNRSFIVKVTRLFRF